MFSFLLVREHPSALLATHSWLPPHPRGSRRCFCRGTVALTHSTPCSPGRPSQPSRAAPGPSGRRRWTSAQGETCLQISGLQVEFLDHCSHPLYGNNGRLQKQFWIWILIPLTVRCVSQLIILIIFVNWSKKNPSKLWTLFETKLSPWLSQTGVSPVHSPVTVHFLWADPDRVNPSWQEKLCVVPTRDHWFLGQMSPWSSWSWEGHKMSERQERN